MAEHRGLVLHIAEGFYEGTISWQRNRANDVSSHFVIGREQGEIAQLVDTDVTAWTQRDGNGHWISAEFAGFTLGHRLHRPGWEELSKWQLECAARLLVRGHHQYGWPLQLATSEQGRGLGHHSMGAGWGHRDCPGRPIIAQKPGIITRARSIAGKPTEGDDDMPTAKEIVDEFLNRDLGKKDGKDTVAVVLQTGVLGNTNAIRDLLKRQTDLLDRQNALLGELITEIRDRG